MAYDGDINGESQAELRKQADRATQAALEREARQKKEREEEHKNTIRRKIHEAQAVLERKKRERGAIELEKQSLGRTARQGARAWHRMDSSASRQAETKVHEITARLDALTSRLRDTRAEFEEHTRKSKTTRTEAKRAVEGLRVPELEKELTENKSARESLSERLAEIGRLLSGRKRSSYAPPDLEVAEEERITRQLKSKIDAARDEEEQVAPKVHEAERKLKADSHAAQATSRGTSGSEIASTLRSKQIELDKSRRELAAEKKELADLETKVKAHETLLTALTEEFEHLKHALQERTEEAKKASVHDREVSSEKEELQKQSDHLASLERDIREYAAELEKHTRLLEIRKHDVAAKDAAHEKEAQALERERTEKAAALAALESSRAETERKLREAKRVSETARTQEEDAGEEDRTAHSLSAEIKREEAEIHALETDLHEHQRHVEENKRKEAMEAADAAETERKAYAARAREHDHEREQHVLDSEIQNLERDIREWEREIA